MYARVFISKDVIFNEVKFPYTFLFPKSTNTSCKPNISIHDLPHSLTTLSTHIDPSSSYEPSHIEHDLNITLPQSIVHSSRVQFISFYCQKVLHGIVKLVGITKDLSIF